MATVLDPAASYAPPGVSVVDRATRTLSNLTDKSAARVNLETDLGMVQLDAKTAPPLAAPRSIRSKYDSWSIRDFGNQYCGRADNLSTADEAASFRKACQTGETIVVPSGRYPIRSIDPDSPSNSGGYAVRGLADTVCLKFDPNSLITIDPAIDGSRALFRFETTTNPSPNLFSLCHLEDLKIDATGAAAVGTGLRLLDMIGFQKVNVIRPVMGSTPAAPSGSNIGFGAADTAIAPTNCSRITIEDPFLFGFGDAAIYVSGNPGVPGRDKYDGVGEFFELKGGFCWRSLNMIVLKRDFMGMSIIGGHYHECGNGISTGTTDSGPNDYARDISIIGVKMTKMARRPILIGSGHGAVIQGCTIRDFGLWISDQSQRTDVTIGGINLWGTSGAQVRGNYVGFREWSHPGGAATADGPHGVVVASNAEGGPEHSFDNVIDGNTFENLYFSVRESSGSDRNRGVNKEINIAAGSQKAGANSLFQSVDSLATIESTTIVPVLTSTTGGDLTTSDNYDTRSCRYFKTGKLVTFEAYFDLSATGQASLNGTVTLNLTGLPAMASTPPIVPINIVITSDMTHSSTSYTEFLAKMSSAGVINFTEYGSSGELGLTHSRFGPNARMAVSGTYIAAA